jgi:Flp pilus assembly protein TadD
MNRKAWIVVIALAVVTVVAYWRVGECGFVNLDDDAYVEFQPMVNEGLRSAGIVWAFTAAHSSNWHPLTSLSHMLDCTVFGLSPVPMHWENVGWHLLDTLLVFLVWRSLSGALWRSAFVAALFALHPLHVESVAWISERKDVLSTFFFLLALWSYGRYARAQPKSTKKRRPASPRKGHYWLTLFFFALGLLAKPMVVTLPLVLLLIDVWPLERLGTKSFAALVREKVPFFILGAIDAAITFEVQTHSGAARYGQRFSLASRLENAIVAVVRYLEKTFWPERLSAFYSHPASWPAAIVLGAAAITIAVTAFVWMQRERRPWLILGWAWFLVMLAPVIGIIQVGAQSMADRYTYVPLLGVFTMVAWGGAEILRRAPARDAIAIAVAVVVLAGCAWRTEEQVRAWRDSIALYEQSIAAGEDNATVRYLLATAMQAAHRPESEVVAQFRRALQLQPDYVNAITQLAVIEMNHGRTDDARRLIEESIRLDPKNPALRKNLGAFYARLNRPADALSHFQEALELDPDYADAHHEIAWLDLNQNRLEEARVQLEQVARANPWDPDTLCELGTLDANLGRRNEGRRLLERAVWIKPDFPRAQTNLRALQ